MQSPSLSFLPQGLRPHDLRIARRPPRVCALQTRRAPRGRIQAAARSPASSPAQAVKKTIPKKERAVISSLDGVSYVVGGVTVVDDISLDIFDGEIICILGPSGSGKSTLLRMLAGLTAPTSGSVRYRGKPFEGPNPGASIVFQTFALYPWLTVLENVELGASGRSRADRERSRERAMRTIDIIGLDGYENAYPRELSGGMRQRVGFARALAVEPELLCMDEPFSALDVLTAENLRSELLRLWMAGDVPTTSVLIVTHGIEEAVSLADRIVILGRDPGHIRTVLNVRMPHPRNRKSKLFQEWADLVYTILSERDDDGSVEEIIANAGGSLQYETSLADTMMVTEHAGQSTLSSTTISMSTDGSATAPSAGQKRLELELDCASASTPLTPIYQQLNEDSADIAEKPRYPQLPGVRIGSVAGLLAFISGEPADLYLLGQRLQLDVDDLYPIIDAAEILGLIEVDDGDVRINKTGLRFMQASIDDRKLLVKEAILKANNTKLIQQIYCMLRQAGTKGELPQELIFDTILLKNFSPQESRRQLEIAIEWGRFAELFGYESLTGTLFLDTGDVAKSVMG